MLKNNFDAKIEEAKQIIKRIEERQSHDNKEALRVAKALCKETDNPSSIYSALYELGYNFNNYDEIDKVLEPLRKKKKRSTRAVAVE